MANKPYPARLHPKAPKPASAVLPSREAVLAFIEESPQKVGKREIAQAFGIKGSDKIELKRLLKDLQEEGVIEKDRSGLRKAGRLPPVVVADIDTRRDRDGELVARPAQWDPEAGPAPIITVLMPRGIDDSKKLSAATRAELCARLMACAQVGIGIVEADEIDRLNIHWATMKAMTLAVEALAVPPGHVLVDGNRLPRWSHPATALVGGDAISRSIAAASIVAKHTRDRIMIDHAAAAVIAYLHRQLSVLKHEIHLHPGRLRVAHDVGRRLAQHQ